MIKVSIIVPVYNIESYIELCIKSIIKQTYKNLEIIIIDDGSEDRSGIICDEFAKFDSRIKIKHTQNKGLSAARNEGIRISSGEYIMFIDGDDFIELNAIKDIVDIIKDKENVDIIAGKKIKYYNDYKKVSDDFTFDYRQIDGKNGIEVLTYFFEEIPSSMWAAWISIYRREFLINNNLYFTEGITSEDLDLIPRVYICSNNIAAYDTPFYYYRQLRPNSIINTVNSKRFYDIIYIVEKYKLLLKENEYEYEVKKSFLKQLANIYSSYVVILGYLPKEERDEVTNRMKEMKNILIYAQGMKGIYVKYSTKYLGFKISYLLYKFMKECGNYVYRVK